MKFFGRAAVSNFLGDFIVYRNLTPVDRRLPPLDMLRREAGITGKGIPRKTDLEYARIVFHLLQHARDLDTPGVKIKRLVFLGDTRLLDATAFANICRVGELPGIAFIGSENNEPVKVEIQPTEDGQILYLANQWSLLADFDDFFRSKGFDFNESTAVLIDLDKTALGARGRNAQMIDQARVEAVRITVEEILGGAFNQADFQEAYNMLVQPEFHPFTTDNQDYVAYTCLILGSRLYDLQKLVEEIRSKRLGSFDQFIHLVEASKNGLSPELREIHESIYSLVKGCDPTPFKAFRYNEYFTTIQRMGFLPDTAGVEQMLEQEILLTEEVRSVGLKWREQGALIFGLSDKPDEASVPGEALSAQGYLPIHRTKTHAVGKG